MQQRSRLAITLLEREEISSLLASQQFLRIIAKQLRRATSTISRKIHRNLGYDNYRATQADQAAWGKAYRPKLCKFSRNPTLSRIVAAKLQLNWSPEQISGWLHSQRTA